MYLELWVRRCVMMAWEWVPLVLNPVAADTETGYVVLATISAEAELGTRRPLDAPSNCEVVGSRERGRGFAGLVRLRDLASGGYAIREGFLSRMIFPIAEFEWNFAFQGDADLIDLEAF